MMHGGSCIFCAVRGRGGKGRGGGRTTTSSFVIALQNDGSFIGCVWDREHSFISSIQALHESCLMLTAIALSESSP